MASQAVEKEVIVILEEDPDDWPDVGPLNPEEADSYIEKINNIFETMAENVLHMTKKRHSTICCEKPEETDESTLAISGGCQSRHHHMSCR